MEFSKMMMISAAGLRAQGTRMRVIAENIANASSLATDSDSDPYRRKTVSFINVLDRKLGLHMVKVHKVGRDDSDFGTRFDPNHPAADADGYVKTPNVQVLIEMMDMREAQRSYEANIASLMAMKHMMRRTVDLLRR